MPNINCIHLPDGNTYDLVKKELTQAEYNALTEEEKNNGTVYLISDVSSSRIDIETLINIIYPVGSIYISVMDDTVAKVEARFGGTWESFGAGRTLVGVDPNDTSFDTVEETGGAKSNSYTPGGTVGNHAITVAELPARAAIQARNPTSAAKATSAVNASWASVSVAAGASCVTSVYDAGANGFVPFGESTTTMGNTPHNHGWTGTAANISTVQPYITTYMYKRIA